MKIRKAWFLIFISLVAACTPARPSIDLASIPKGITYLEGIDPVGLRSPIWSPDGKKIVASYNIYSLPDFPGTYKPRHDIVLIDAEAWKSTILYTAKGTSLYTQAWTSDSDHIVFDLESGPEGEGIYTFQIDSPQPTLLYQGDNLYVSPDLTKVASIEKFDIKITDITSNESQKYNMPVSGVYWYFGSWSSDMERIALIYRGNDNDRFDNIFVLNLKTGKFSRFTNDTTYFKGVPLFSVDGQLIAYLKMRFVENEPIHELLIARMDQSCEWIIPLRDVDYYAWSPDGKKMILVGNNGAYLADLKVLFGDDFPNGKNCSTGN